MARVEKTLGERIFLESLDENALSLAYQEWMKDPQVLCWLANPAGDYSPEALKSFVAQMNVSPVDYMVGIFLKADGRHIGNVKIGKVDRQHGFADVGIVIGDKTLWGQGFATETVRLTGELASKQLGLNKLCAGVVVGNEGSYKAFLKAGFVEVGRYHQHWLVDGKYCDAYILENVLGKSSSPRE